MRRRLVLATSLMLVLMGVLSATFRVQKVEATIYIKADGSIDPASANITSADNIFYTFIGNVNDTIVVERDNILVDGAGYTVQGSGSGTGIFISGNNVTIKNVQIKNLSYGIYLDESSSNTVMGSNITANSDHGIYVRSSTYNNITGNHITNNGEDGIYLYGSSNNSICGNNVVDNEAGIHLYGSTHNRISGNNITENGGVQVGGGIWLDGAGLNTISGNNITANTWHGLDLDKAYNNTISGNKIEANKNRAIMLYSYSNYNNITGNDIIDNYQGIEVSGSSYYNTISGNNLTANDNEGVYIEYSNYNSISGNNMTGNSPSIMVWRSSNNNTISGNTITDGGTAITLGDDSNNNSVSGNTMTNSSVGIAIRYCSNNTLRDNIMINNTYNFGIWISSLPHFLNDVDDSNTVQGKPIYYWVNRHDSAVPSDAGCVILANCSNISIQNVNISHNWQGVVLAHTTNTTIATSNITKTEYCIWLWNSSNCHVNENYVSQFIGIQLDYSTNNTIYRNTITGCGNWGGIGLSQSSNNTFYRNNFTDNYIHVKIDTASVNNWDNNYPEGGNYWDNFEDIYHYAEDVKSGPYQNITGSDGFWDTPYTMNADNIDHYPIVPEFPSFIIMPLFIIATLLAVIICRRKHSM